LILKDIIISEVVAMYQRTLFLLILGISLGFLGFVVGLAITSENVMLAKNASESPETISLAELSGREVEANRHLRLTQFGFGYDYLYRGSPEKWDRVWLPLIDPSSTKSKPVVLGVMICRRVANRLDYVRIQSESSFAGMNVSGVEFIPTELQTQLKGFYPDTDFSKIPVFEEGRTPPSEDYIFWTQVVMMVSFAIGLTTVVAWIAIAKWHVNVAHAG